MVVCGAETTRTRARDNFPSNEAKSLSLDRPPT